MIKKIAWDTFKNTGDINTFMEFKQIQDIENNIKEIQDIQKITNIKVEEKEDNVNTDNKISGNIEIDNKLNNTWEVT